MNKRANIDGRREPLPKTKAAGKRAFTLIELLLVIAIMGLLLATGIPALKGMTKSNAMIAANRQLLDAVGYARQRAISDHTTVYMVFVPPNITTFSPPPLLDTISLKQYTNLYGGQYVSYALLSLRLIGEQPGRATPHYLTDWKTLPTGVFIATNKFGVYDPAAPDGSRSFAVNNGFPFPTATNVPPGIVLPYVAFDYLGRLTSGRDEYIPLSRGSIFFARGPDGNFVNQAADVQESPAGNSINNSNVIHIDWLTGRAKLERQEVQ